MRGSVKPYARLQQMQKKYIQVTMLWLAFLHDPKKRLRVCYVYEDAITAEEREKIIACHNATSFLFDAPNLKANENILWLCENYERIGTVSESREIPDGGVMTAHVFCEVDA